MVEFHDWRDGLSLQIFGRDNQLWAAVLNLDTLNIGDPVPVVESVLMRPNGSGAQFSVSDRGLLVYATAPSGRRLVWVDRSGNSRLLTDERHLYAMPRLAPNGETLAVEVHEIPHQIWTLDMKTGILSRLTRKHSNHNFAWSPDGRGLLFVSGRGERNVLAWKTVMGAGIEEIVLESDDHTYWLDSWSMDGKWVAGRSTPTDSRRMDADVYIVPFSTSDVPRPTGEPIPITTSPAQERDAMISPDSRCIALNSDETGRFEIYVYCQPDAQWDGPDSAKTRLRRQISIDGGREPQWAKDGNELFYRSGNRLMAVGFQLDSTIRIESPQVVFEGDYVEFHPANYDVSRDGLEFVRVQEDKADSRILVRVNWFEQIRNLTAEQ